MLQELIRNKAKELGFIACGFAKYDVLGEEAGRLKQWLDAGYDADMNWIEKGFEKRRDIKNIIPDAKSVISLAFNYYTPFEHEENKPKISRYAWGNDYHKILKKKLKELCKVITSPPAPLLRGEGGKEYDITYNNDFSKLNPLHPSPIPLKRDFENASHFLEGEGGIQLKAYVDDGPVMDKVWAQRTGIGWMGKHTNIINPEYGSWFFLCEIITNIEFEQYDNQTEDLCGECSLCISACPTGAITQEYIVDSNKCISYQTIENRGEIPEEINLDGWIFGCDICQDVCPYNSPKYNHVTGENDFYPLKETLPLIKGEWPKAEAAVITQTSPNPLLTKEGTINFTEEEFNKIFANSPVKRTKYAGWIRNLERIQK